MCKNQAKHLGMGSVNAGVIDHLKSSFSELCRYIEARRHHPRRRRNHLTIINRRSQDLESFRRASG
jgi:hypothetical protein